MKIFLDACAIIYWVELAEPYYMQFNNKVQKIRKKYKKIDFMASYLSVLECRVRPLKENNKEVLKQYRDFFCAPDLFLVEISPSIIEDATHLRAFTGLRTPDAIQAASALSTAEEVIFLTNDKSFKKIPRLNVHLI